MLHWCSPLGWQWPLSRRRARHKLKGETGAGEWWQASSRAQLANSTPGYSGYYGYGYPAYGYAYPRYGLGYGYGPAYGVSYAYPAYNGGYDRPYNGYAYAGPRAVRRVVVHRARWR